MKKTDAGQQEWTWKINEVARQTQDRQKWRKYVTRVTELPMEDDV